jgi:hypothetical protein
MRVRLLHENVQISQFVQIRANKEKDRQRFSVGPEVWVRVHIGLYRRSLGAAGTFPLGYTFFHSRRTIPPWRANAEPSLAQPRAVCVPAGVFFSSFGARPAKVRAGRKTLPLLCIDGSGVDRDAIHAKTAALAEDFFGAALK